MPIYIVKATPPDHQEIKYTVVAEEGRNQAIEMFKYQVQTAYPNLSLEDLQIDCHLQD